MRSSLAFLLFALGASAALAERDGPRVLFVQHADAGTLAAGKGSAEEMTLTLEGVAPSIVFFSDRPFRLAGSEPFARLVARWGSGEDSFLEDPPNAALELPGGDVIILELGRPRYDSAASRVRYPVRALAHAGHAAAVFQPHLGPRVAPLGPLPRTFSDAVLFIDDAAPDQELYRVVINAQGVLSIVPASQPTPPGWIDVGVQAPKQECLDYIEEFEIEGVPLELRKKMEDMAQQQGSGHP